MGSEARPLPLGDLFDIVERLSYPVSLPELHEIAGSRERIDDNGNFLSRYHLLPRHWHGKFGQSGSLCKEAGY